MNETVSRVPQQDGGWFLTDGGLETVLIFQEGITLPEFAAFVLLRSRTGREQLRRYFRRYLEIAVNTPGSGFVLESPTWRAGWDWGAKLGFDADAMGRFNRDAIGLLGDLRAEYAARIAGPIVVSGCIGPRGDGYVAGAPMALDDAQRVHQPQVDALVDAGADMITAITMTTSAEGIGVARAAARASKPSAISFTLETDGRLPNGQTLQDAIEQCDRETAGGPAYYMINCAHPTHFEAELRKGGAWLSRLRGLAANSSKRSHAELDSSPDLDIGNPVELGQDYRRLQKLLPQLVVLGGCCGTDHRHVEQICASCLTAEAA
jgi:homocysteine S-methyltransferase